MPDAPATIASTRRIRRGMTRTLVIGAVAVAGLGLTVGLLWSLSPRPLVPDAVRSLPSLSQISVETPADSAATAPDAIAVRNLATALYEGLLAEPAAWAGVELVPTGTRSGDASTLADADAARGRVGPGVHFVICNGLGGADGEIQVTALWDRQRPAPAAVEPGRVRVAVVAADAGSFTARQSAAVRVLAASLAARDAGAI